MSDRLSEADEERQRIRDAVREAVRRVNEEHGVALFRVAGKGEEEARASMEEIK